MFDGTVRTYLEEKHTAILLNPNNLALLTRSAVKSSFLAFLLYSAVLSMPCPTSTPIEVEVVAENIPKPVIECSYNIAGREARELSMPTTSS